MKHQTLHLLALTMLAPALFTLTSCSSTSQPPPAVGSAKIAYTKGVPGGVLFQTVKVTATVTAIDLAARKATLQGSVGRKFTVKMGPGAVNFDQIRVGDQVAATLTQKVVVSVDDNKAPSGEGTTVAAETAQITAKVIAIDSEKRTATLRLEDGATETLPVRADVDLSRHKVGEQVVFRLIEMIAIWVEKSQ